MATHTQQLLSARETRRAQCRASSVSREAGDELIRAIVQLRALVQRWDGASRNQRKVILERFLWLHSQEGAAIGAERTLTKSGSTLGAGAGGGGASVAAALAAVSDSQAHKQKSNEESKQTNAAANTAAEPKTIALSTSVSSLLSSSGGANSLANASLESLYGASASLLLMRITSWLRLTYTLQIANLQCLRAISTFCCDSAGGLRFVHEFVEAGGIATLLSIIDRKPPEQSEQSKRAEAAREQASLATADDVHHPYTHAVASHNISAEAAAAHAAEMERLQALREQLEIEKAHSILILHRIAFTGRGFKEMICEQKGVGIIIHCLANVLREHTQEVAKQLLCQLGMGNPRYASLVHEELLSVFRNMSSPHCKKLVTQTLYFLLSHTSSTDHDDGLRSHRGSTSSLKSSSAAVLPPLMRQASAAQAQEYDVQGNPIEPFSADARYVEATVSLFHIPDYQLHYEANQLLKLLITKHNLAEACLLALLNILKQKQLNSPTNSSSNNNNDNNNNNNNNNNNSNPNAQSGRDGSNPGKDSDPRRDRSLPMVVPGSSNKQADPKTCAVKLLNELALMSYELCLRMSQLGVIPLLLDCLCNMNHYELQHWSSVLLFTLNNNVVESASLIRFMMNGVMTTTNSVSESLYVEFLRNPENLHRHLTYADVRKIQNNLYNPQTQSSFLSQRRMERKKRSASIKPGEMRPPLGRVTSTATSTAASAAASASNSRMGSRKGSITSLTLDGSSTAAQTQSGHSSTGSLLISPSSDAAASAMANSFGGFYQMPSTQSAEDEEAAFFALGLATVARKSEVDDLAAQLRAERLLEKERERQGLSPGGANGTKLSVTDSLEREHKTSDVVQSLLRSVEQRKKTLEGHDSDSSDDESKQQQLQRQGSKSGKKQARPTDAINVPATQLHFDTKLKLADQGPPQHHHNHTLLKLTLGSSPGSGVHEGVNANPNTAGADTSGQMASLVWTPFAAPSTDAVVTTIDDQGDQTTDSAKPAVASAANAGDGSAMVFSQRVGIQTSHELKSDPVSDGYLNIHFKDLTHADRASFLQHGAPGLMASLTTGGGSDDTGVDGGDADQLRDFLLPDVIPHVDILVHDGAAGGDVDKKSEAVKQEELKRKRDEKRTKHAEVAAAAAQQHAAATKYAKPTEKFEGFTAATIPKQKTADELSSSKRILTLAEAKVQRMEEERRAATQRALASVVGEKVAASKVEAEALLNRVASTKSIIQMAIQLDSAGRTIDPRHWAGGRGKKEHADGDEAARKKGAATTTVGGAATKDVKKSSQPATIMESDADKRERLAIEAELAQLRGVREEQEAEQEADLALQIEGTSKDRKKKAMKRASMNMEEEAVEDNSTAESSPAAAPDAAASAPAANITATAAPRRIRALNTLVSASPRHKRDGSAESPHLGVAGAGMKKPANRRQHSGGGSNSSAAAASPRSESLLDSIKSTLSVVTNEVEQEDDGITETTITTTTLPSAIHMQVGTSAFKRTVPMNAAGRPMVRRNTISPAASSGLVASPSGSSSRPSPKEAADASGRRRQHSLGTASSSSIKPSPRAAAATARAIAQRDYSIAD